jgi:hypothetical protein
MGWSKLQSVSAANVTTTITLTLNGVGQNSLLTTQCSYYRVAQNNNTPPGTPTDTNGTMLPAIVPVAINTLAGSTDSGGVAIWYEKGAASGTHTVVITIPNCTVAHGTLTEFSGGDGTLDMVASTMAHSNANFSTSGMTSPLAQTNDLAVAAVFFGAGTGQANAQISDPPTGYISLFVMENSATDLPTEFAYRFLANGDPQMVLWSWIDNTTCGSAGAIATFMLNAPVGANVGNVTVSPNATVNVINFSNSSQNLASITIPSETMNVYYTSGANTNNESLTSNTIALAKWPTTNATYVINGNNSITVSVNSVGGIFPNTNITIPGQNNSVLFH